MPTYNFTGPPLVTSGPSRLGGIFYGGTTHPDITFTFSFSFPDPGPVAYFDLVDQVGVLAYGLPWSAPFGLSFIPSTTTVIGLQFDSGSSPYSASTSSVSLGGTTFIHFNISGSGNLQIQGFNTQCFLKGTRIATPTGEVAVQDLAPGDLVLTADGGETTVQWLGCQNMTPRFQHPDEINPICITAGALATGVPKRNLYLGADHAVERDGMLINAGALINGRSIYRVADMPLDGFSYFHVETDAHQVILAEGCAAETFLDIPSRAAFENGAERADAPPIAEMPQPRITSARLLPAPLRDQIAARAEDASDKRLVG